MQGILEKLIAESGKENVIKAAEALLEEEQKKKAGSYHDLVSPEKLSDDLQLYKSALQDVAEAGKAVEDAYNDRSLLTKKLTQLNTNIELTEAEAFMQLEGNKVQIDGKTVTLSNDKMRDMYRKYVSREERAYRADIEADLKKIEIDIYKAKDRWEEAKTNADLIKSRAYVQANLLQFLS